MHPYLYQTEHAITSLLDLTHKCTLKSIELDSSQKRADLNDDLLYLETNNTEYELDIGEFLDIEEIDPVQEFIAEKYLTESRQELNEIKEELQKLDIELKANIVSINALSTAVLQIARQGLSIAYSPERGKTLSSSPQVRCIHGIPVQEIIWDGRNHAIHYEESPNHNQNTKALFEKLEKYYGSRFSLKKNPHKSLAGDLIDLLGWNNYGLYLQDLEKLLS